MTFWFSVTSISTTRARTLDVIGARVKAWWTGEQAQTIATQTGQVTRDAAANSPAAFVASIGKRLSAWIFGESAQTAGTVAGVTARTTAEGTGAAASVAINSGRAVTNIGTSALEAMAGAWNAMVGIPYVGPVLAIGAAAAAFAGVSALAGRVKSARGGYDIPSGINPMTQLHEEEMVLPKEHANTIRGMGKNGGAGKDGSAGKDGAAAQPVNVTYNDDTTGNLAAITLGATARASRAFPLVPNVAGKYIKAVNSVTLAATTGTAGNFGITATRLRSGVSVPVANKTEFFDWAALGFPEAPNDSCLMMLMTCSTTSTGALRGQARIAHG